MRPHGEPTGKLITLGRLVTDLRCEDVRWMEVAQDLLPSE
jgi:hypothetical protein